VKNVRLKFEVICYSNQCLDLLSDFFPPGISAKILYAFIVSPMYATGPTYFMILITFSVKHTVYSSQYATLRIISWLIS
jgi:hypothetical protein